MGLETIFVGILLALLYVEVIGIYPGGIIVPAYIALSLDNPWRAAATILVAVLSLFAYRLLSRFFILFGKRRFVVMLLLGGVAAQLVFLLFPHLAAAPSAFKAVGWIIPGLLANNLERQKFFPTLASLAAVSITTYFLAKLVGMIF